MNFVKRLFWGQYRFYSISTSILFVWMFILDSNDLTVQYRLWSELSEMKAEKAFYQQKNQRIRKGETNGYRQSCLIGKIRS
jgi:cell division protein DivIC